MKEGAKGIYIDGVREEIVTSGPDVLKWIKKATSNRSIAATSKLYRITSTYRNRDECRKLSKSQFVYHFCESKEYC